MQNNHPWGEVPHFLRSKAGIDLSFTLGSFQHQLEVSRKSLYVKIVVSYNVKCYLYVQFTSFIIFKDSQVKLLLLFAVLFTHLQILWFKYKMCSSFL